MAFPPGSMLFLERPQQFIAEYTGLRDITVDYARGGKGINDPSLGIDLQTWRATAKPDGVWVGSSVTGNSYKDEALLYPHNDIKSVTLAFDNNMQPALAMELKSQPTTLLYWFDSVTHGFVTTTYPGYVECFVRKDDTRDGSSAYNDIIFSYNNSNQLMYRIQRDRYSVEYKIQDLDPMQQIYQCGPTVGLRFQYDIVWNPLKRNFCEWQ
jgi:hypothetical protein